MYRYIYGMEGREVDTRLCPPDVHALSSSSSSDQEDEVSAEDTRKPLAAEPAVHQTTGDRKGENE